jgi:hypothetical protein
MVPDRALFERERARSFHRGITCLALSSGRPEAAAALLARTWASDQQAELVIKATTSPTTTSSFPAITTAATLQTLAPKSASMQLFGRCVQVSLDGISKIRVPHILAAPVPAFVGEGAVSPVAMFSLAGVDVGPARKILIMAAVSDELEVSSPEVASVVIGRALAEAATRSLDAVVFGAAAADTVKPAGLFYNVTPLAASGTGSDTEQAMTDVATLADAIGDANIAVDDLVIVAAPAQATKLRLLAGPSFTNMIVATNALAAGTVAAIAPQGVVFAYAGPVATEFSKEATLHFEDATPLPISSSGSPNTVAAPVRSAFQTGVLVVKVRARASWGALPGSVQVVTGVGW